MGTEMTVADALEIAVRVHEELERLEEPLQDGRADATRRVKRDLLKRIIDGEGPQ